MVAWAWVLVWMLYGIEKGVEEGRNYHVGVVMWLSCGCCVVGVLVEKGRGRGVGVLVGLDGEDQLVWVERRTEFVT